MLQINPDCILDSANLKERLLGKMKRIRSKADLKEWLAYEKNQYGIGNSVISFVLAWLYVSEKHISWRIQRRLRVTEYYLNCGHRFRYKLSVALYHRIAFKAGIKIPPNTCGKGLHIVHLGDIMINEDARIGEDAVLHINCVVSAGSAGKKAVLGDGVYLFIGAKVLKGVAVNDRVMIGAGAVVTKDIQESNICVAGIPAHKVSDRK